MTTVTAARFQGAAVLPGRSQRPRTGQLIGRLVLALLIVGGAMIAADPSSVGFMLRNQGAAESVLAVTGVAINRPADPVTTAQVTAAGNAAAGHTAAGHTGAARGRMQAHHQLAKCLHRAHRTGSDPVSCQIERR